MAAGERIGLPPTESKSSELPLFEPAIKQGTKRKIDYQSIA